MQAKLQACTDCKAMKGDLFELLEAIKEHSVSCQENKHPMNSITDAIRNIVNLKQKEDAPLIKHTQRFKVTRDVLKSQLGGPLMLTPIAQGTKDCDKKDPDKVKECQEKACQQWLSFVCIGNTDHAKHGTSVSGLSSQHALGQDQHPKKLVDAMSVLSNHHFDAVHAE